MRHQTSPESPRRRQEKRVHIKVDSGSSGALNPRKSRISQRFYTPAPWSRSTSSDFPWTILLLCLTVFIILSATITAYRNAEAGGSYVKTVRHVKDQARLAPEVMER